MKTENDKAIAKILDYAKCGLYHNYPCEDFHKEKHDYFDEAVKLFKSQSSDLAQAKNEIEKLQSTITILSNKGSELLDNVANYEKEIDELHESVKKLFMNNGKTHDSYLEVVEMYASLKIKANDLENDMKKIANASTNVECWVIANNSLSKYKK